MANKTFFHILMHIGHLLERLTAEELQELNLHHGQGRLLATLKRCGAITQANLARGIDVKPATLSNMLKPLENRALIERSPDPKTNRALVVKLTAEGDKLAQAVEKKWDKIEQNFRDTLITTDQEELFIQLEAFREVLGGSKPVFITHDLKDNE